MSYLSYISKSPTGLINRSAKLMFINAALCINNQNIIKGTPKELQEKFKINSHSFEVAMQELKRNDLVRKYTKTEYMFNPDYMCWGVTADYKVLNHMWENQTTRGLRKIEYIKKVTETPINYIYALERPPIMCTSSKARVLILDIIIYMGTDNLFNKSKIAKAMGMCNRTFNKYWRELVTANLIVKSDEAKIWMINPRYFKHPEVTSMSLYKKWGILDGK
ncbi:MAG: hypothetical protein U9O94_06085 [Nanoarchaeota archaeon]|nr:hypothetical protein [Nanoarchaeota archaeon]